MGAQRTLPMREQVFIASLRRHGYVFTEQRTSLKRRKRYIIPATKHEDSGGIDFWIKPPRSTRLIPIQVTQRGTSLFCRFHAKSESVRAEFDALRARRLNEKRRACRDAHIAFVLVRDHAGTKPSRHLAWGDAKALRYALVPFLRI